MKEIMLHGSDRDALIVWVRSLLEMAESQHRCIELLMNLLDACNEMVPSNLDNTWRRADQAKRWDVLKDARQFFEHRHLTLAQVMHRGNTPKKASALTGPTSTWRIVKLASAGSKLQNSFCRINNEAGLGRVPAIIFGPAVGPLLFTHFLEDITMSRNKNNRPRPSRTQTPATPQPPARRGSQQVQNALGDIGKPIGQLLEEAAGAKESFSAQVEKGGMSLEVGYTPPHQGEEEVSFRVKRKK